MKNEEEQNTVCPSEIDRPHLFIPIYNPLRPFAALLTAPRSVQISVGPHWHPCEQQPFGCGPAALFYHSGLSRPSITTKPRDPEGGYKSGLKNEVDRFAVSAPRREFFKTISPKIYSTPWNSGRFTSQFISRAIPSASSPRCNSRGRTLHAYVSTSKCVSSG